ncbi:MAG: endonuclease III [Bacteroidales bacterium]|nr:endonuclease III [Bacteroidales bacterium]MDD4210013.1 endonuclease III [Bacteroidales bacterium]
MNKKARYSYIIEYFSKNHPDASSELHYKNPYELLIAVILSAQCTDKRVNITTPRLFQHYPDAEKLAKASIEEVFEIIKSISYPNNKSKYLVEMANKLLTDFNGIVPDNIEDLQTLPGVGRKTANVVASVVFNKPTMPVDTHVFRVAARIGLTKNAKNPLQTEKQLVAHIPEPLIAKAHHWLILHGRYICVARKPKCEKCGLQQACNYYEKNHKL